MKLLIAAVLLVALGGCAANSTIVRAPLEKAEITNRIQQSPIVQYLGEFSFAKQREPAEIELHYKLFHVLNRPDAIKNWERYYVLGKPSSPKWDYTEIADISVYQITMDDKKALDIIRKKTSEIGGAGVIDLYKKPITAPGTSTRSYDTITTPIEAYSYFGRVIRENKR